MSDFWISSDVEHWKPAAVCSAVSATLTRRAMVLAPACTVTMRTGIAAKAARQRLH